MSEILCTTAGLNLTSAARSVISSLTCSGGNKSTSNSSFLMYSGDGVHRTTVGWAGSDGANAACLREVADKPL